MRLGRLEVRWLSKGRSEAARAWHSLLMMVESPRPLPPEFIKWMNDLYGKPK